MSEWVLLACESTDKVQNDEVVSRDRSRIPDPTDSFESGLMLPGPS